MDPISALASLGVGKKKGAKKGKKSRKVGRNYRWDYVSHSSTRYMATGGPARRARRLAARAAKWARRQAAGRNF